MWRGLRGGLAARALALGVGVGLFAPGLADAHDGRPAHLEIVETDDGGVAIRLSEPVSPWVTAHLTPWLSSGWLDGVPAALERGSDVDVRHWRVDPPREPLAGQTLRVDGFDPAFNEAVLVRVIFADGTAITTFLTIRQPSLRITRDTTTAASRLQYLWLGVQHIAMGPDHLLFVLGLVLLVRDRWRLVGTITAFTLAHSVTLAAAALEVVRLPVDAVEAVIALSLVCLAVELVHAERGRCGLMARVPWAVAMAFGLLHGFGFASTLLDVGLPPGDVPMALLAFNVGVEMGQVAFVLLVLPVLATWRELVREPPAWARLVPAYGIGTLAMYWVAERVAVAL
jgi:hydrogenase/urease accessory protein HupE